MSREFYDLSQGTEAAFTDRALTALFFAALPYRRIVFARGGWPFLFPDPKPWQTHRAFLSSFWSRTELAASESRARQFLDDQGPRAAVLFGGAGFPAVLSTIYDPPPALFFRGPVPNPQAEFLAVVGTRKPDAIALQAVDRLAVRIQHSSNLGGLLRSCVETAVSETGPITGKQLLLFHEVEAAVGAGPVGGSGSGRCPVGGKNARFRGGEPRRKESEPGAGFVTVSGFAFGVDARIHRASFLRGIPTVAVLGSGIDHITPEGNRHLIHEADSQGAVLSFCSEFFPDDPPRRFAYPRRNRIIAGMSRVVFIMQAGLRSGALITARYGLDEGRDICVFDHAHLSGAGKNEGGRRLLEEGAGALILFSPV